MSFWNIIKNFLKKENNIQNCASYSSSTTKHAMNSSCTLKLSTKTEEIKKEIHEELKTRIRKYINNPEKLIQYFRLKGIEVYRVKNAEKLLNEIGEEEGFITPLRGLKALHVNLLIINPKHPCNLFSTKEILVFDSKEVEIYTIARALYKYYGFKRKLPGYEHISQEIFKKIYNKKKNSKDLIDKLPLGKLFSCKEALARDLESIKFAVELSKEYQSAKEALKKMKDNGANI